MMWELKSSKDTRQTSSSDEAAVNGHGEAFASHFAQRRRRGTALKHKRGVWLGVRARVHKAIYKIIFLT